jgi:imidazolonepropionase-like amidohydrolase
VTVHASTADAIDLAIEAGVDSIEHAEEASDDQLSAMRDKGIFLGATEWTRQALIGPYERIFKLSPQEQSGKRRLL